MSVTIKIGTKTLTKDGIIYISPNGSDSNNGTEDNPVKTYLAAIKKCKDNYAIKFMNGTHNLGSYYASSVNITFLSDSYCVETSSSKPNEAFKNIVVFSDPINTVINFNTTINSTNYFHTFVSMYNLSLYNLNIRCNGKFSRVNYTCLLSAPKQSTGYFCTMHNCLITTNYTDLSGNKGEYHWYDIYNGYLYLYNSILYLDFKGEDNYYTNGQYLYNSIVTDMTAVEKAKSNTVYFNPTSTNIDGIIEEGKALCTDTRGLYAGNYSEWLQIIEYNSLVKLFFIKYISIICNHSE